MKYIDTQTHVYSNDDRQYPPIPTPTRPPGDTGSYSSLSKLSRENNVALKCVIQPSSFYGWDNRFLCDLALAEQRDTVGICTVNPDDDSSPSLLARMVESYNIRGFRNLPAANGRLDHPGVRNLWKVAADQGITINTLVRHENAEALASLLRDYPNVRCVIDHCLLLSNGPNKTATLNAMLRLAEHPNAFAKISFIPLGSSEDYPYSDMHDACRTIIAEYSPRRCVWGSNFPCELWTPKSTYEQNLKIITHHLDLSDSDQEEILWNTPWKLWFSGYSQDQ